MVQNRVKNHCANQGLQRLVVLSSGPENTFVGVTPPQREKIEKIALELVKSENEEFSLPALQLLVTCMYIGKQSCRMCCYILKLFSLLYL